MLGMVRGDTFQRRCAPSSALAWAPTLVREEMKYWLLRPDSRLQREVRSYFIVEAGRRQHAKQELHLPDGYSELVFTFGERFDRAPLGCDHGTAQMARSYLIGARSHSVVTRDTGNVRVVGVKLEPRMLRQLIRVPLSTFRDATVDLHELNHKPLLELEAALGASVSPRAISTVLDRFFLLQQRTSEAAESVVDPLLDRIRAKRGAVTISECTRETGVDLRKLERAFLDSVGMTPKKYARIVRFKHAYHALVSNQNPPARTRVNPDSYLDSYYDQSHFCKDFKFFTGASPATLLASRTPASTAVTNHLLQGDLSAA